MKKAIYIEAAAVIFLSVWTCVAQTSAPVKDDLFNGTEIFAKGASDVTEVTMDPDTLGMVGGKDKMKAHTMVLNVVRTYEYDKPGMYRIEDVDAFRNKLNTGEWHCSVHTRSLKTGESTDVCNKRRGDDMMETAIITVEPKSLTFIHTIRKKNTDGSESVFYDMPFMYGLPGRGSLAMLDPEAFADMAIAKARMAGMNFRFDSALSQMPKIDSKQIQKQLDDATQSLDKLQKQHPQSDTLLPKQPE